MEGKRGLLAESSFRASIPEFRKAVVIFSQGDKDGKIWFKDVDLLLRLAFGQGASRHDQGWKEYDGDCGVDDGMTSAAAVLQWVDCGDLAEVLERSEREMEATLLVLGEMKEGSVHEEAEESTVPCKRATSLGSSSGKLKSEKGSFCELVETFNRFDCDANGVICARDLRCALTTLTGRTPSLQECKGMIHRVDANYDGVVDLAEFIVMMSGPKMTSSGRRA